MDAAFAGGARGFRSAADLSWREGGFQQFEQSFHGRQAIGRLRAVNGCDHVHSAVGADAGSQDVTHMGLFLVRERGLVHIKCEVDAGIDFVDVLPAGTAAPREGELKTIRRYSFTKTLLAG